MDLREAVQTLEALASGCSPITGEEIDKESVLHERDVIRALQIAIDMLKKEAAEDSTVMAIAEEDILTTLAIFEEEKFRPTPNRLMGFLAGTRKFKKEELLAHALYGKYEDRYPKGQMLDFFTQYLEEHGPRRSSSKKNAPHREINFFREERFNRLKESAINQLKEKIAALGMVRPADDLGEIEAQARQKNPRAYEPWTDAEKELLRKAMEYTNDLDLLSACFLRGKSSLESAGQRLLYTAQEEKE